MERFNKCIEVVREAGKYLKGQIDKIVKLKELRYDIKLLQDMESEKIIVGNIKKFFPEDSFLCEESNFEKKNEKNLWIIDPLDGSLNFSRGIPHFCISVAFNGKKEKFGIVYDFSRDEMFTGIEGKGAFLNNKKIEVSKTDRIENAILGIGFMRNEKDIEYGIYFLGKILKKIKRIRMMGSASLDICYVASGRIDLTFHLNLNRWDYEGSKIILKEAGGEFEEIEKEGIRIFKSSNGKINLEI